MMYKSSLSIKLVGDGIELFSNVDCGCFSLHRWLSYHSISINPFQWLTYTINVSELPGKMLDLCGKYTPRVRSAWQEEQGPNIL